jgi:hypothetical protein
MLVKVSLAIDIANKAGDSHPGMTTLLLKLLPFRGLRSFNLKIFYHLLE